MSTTDSPTFHFQDDDLSDDNFQIHGNTRLYILILFSIILLITFFFFLYHHYLLHPTTTTAAYRTNFPSPPATQLQGLNPATINSLPITIHRSDMNERLRSEMNETATTTSECSICLGVFEDGQRVKVLPVCCHCYHCECIDKWLMTRSSCPVCRTAVRVDSVV